MLKRPVILFSGLLLAAVLVLGIARLFQLRFDRGDLYAPYSTLRSDPLGASVFYESLARVPEVSSRRYFEKTFTEENGRERALFILGTDPFQLSYLPRSEFNSIQQFVYSGGRVVISCYPEVSRTFSTRQKERELEQEKKTEAKKSKKKKSSEKPVTGKPDENDEQLKPDENQPEKQLPDNKDSGNKDDDQDFEDDWRGKIVDLRDAWGFRTEFENLVTNEEGKVEFPVARLDSETRDLPAEVTLHTALYFSRLTNGWTTIYSREKLPVIIERRFGKGSVVLAADSYWFSNEALYKQSDMRLLAWILGNGREAIFDEAHLGVASEAGIAALMRKYRLHGLVFSLVLLSGLFIWKNSLSLVPPQPDGADANGAPVIEGKDSIAGFVNLLRRGIPRSEIVTACVDEWKKSGGRRAAISTAQRQQIEQLMAQQNELPARRRNPVETYRAICEVLRRKK